MNIDKKLELAHEYAKILLKDPQYSPASIRDISWMIADEMEAEYNKRKKLEDEKSNKDVLAIIDGFEVDWSQAPDWAVAWTADKSEFLWWNEPPCFKGAVWFSESGTWRCSEAPSFNYRGDWKDSLRKRP